MDMMRPMITYPWIIAMMDGDHVAALLLNQVIYWHMRMGFKPFYKAISPAGAIGDQLSWCEEMCITESLFNRKRDLFCTKVDHPLSVVTGKTDADGRILPVNHVVQSYHDKANGNFLWWTVNLPLLSYYAERYGGRVLKAEDGAITEFRISIPSKRGIDTLKTSDRYTQNVESSNKEYQKSTTEELQSGAYRELFVAVAEVHKHVPPGETIDGDTAKDIREYADFLEEIGIDADGVRGFPAWYQETVQVANLPKRLPLFKKHYRAYKAALCAERDAVERDRLERLRINERRKELIF